MNFFGKLYAVAKDYAKVTALEIMDEVYKSNCQITLQDNKLTLKAQSPNKSGIEWIVKEDSAGNIQTSSLKVKLETHVGTINYKL